MPDDKLIDPFLRKLARRDTLSSIERAALVGAAGKIIQFAAGADLVSEGDHPENSLLLVDGFSSRYNLLEDGRRQITAIHVPGDFVDLHGFVLKEMDHSVGALSGCTILTFPHRDLKTISEQHPHLTRLLWLMTMIDAGIQREWMIGMGRRSSPAQLAHLLCELFLRLDVAGRVKDGAFVFPITQTELADALGMSTVHVNRVLQELRSEGLVTWQGQSVHIPVLEQLAERAGFNDNYLHLEREPR
jgi:CRP-like cAMP-binding protein